MAGGLLNLIATGSQNLILNGNPQKTFWSSTHKSYTNFGLQNFRLDYEGLRQMQLAASTVFTFKVKRYADLLMDMWLVVQLPDIYSPIAAPLDFEFGRWLPYEFRWIRNLGAMMIETIRFTIGGALIQQITGHQIVVLANRDLTADQKAKWDEAVGNVPDLYDPGNGVYPHATQADAEPSIRGREIYVPIPVWWGLTPQQAFPLTSLQYNEMQVEITLRPIYELFQIREFASPYERIAPNPNNAQHRFHRFLQPPTNASLDYASLGVSWNENIHLSCTYCFLSDDETKVFALYPQQYLIKELYETRFPNIPATGKAWLQNSTGLVTGWSIFLQRSDVALRNEWSNYTAWPFQEKPSPAVRAGLTMADSPVPNEYEFTNGASVINVPAGTLGYGLNPDGSLTDFFSSGAYTATNERDILLTLGITFDGATREEVRSASTFRYQQPYLASPGKGLVGLYCYNFCLNTSPFVLQPSGAINLGKYSKIELEFATISPPFNPEAAAYTICDPETLAAVGVSKQNTNIYTYNFDLVVIEERYNVLTFMSGNAALMEAR